MSKMLCCSVFAVDLEGDYWVACKMEGDKRPRICKKPLAELEGIDEVRLMDGCILFEDYSPSFTDVSKSVLLSLTDRLYVMGKGKIKATVEVEDDYNMLMIIEFPVYRERLSTIKMNDMPDSFLELHKGTVCVALTINWFTRSKMFEVGDIEDLINKLDDEDVLRILNGEKLPVRSISRRLIEIGSISCESED